MTGRQGLRFIVRAHSRVKWIIPWKETHMNVGKFNFQDRLGSKYLSIGSGGVIGPLEGVESTVGSLSQTATSTAVTWLTHISVIS